MLIAAIPAVIATLVLVGRLRPACMLAAAVAVAAVVQAFQRPPFSGRPRRDRSSTRDRGHQVPAAAWALIEPPPSGTRCV
jgi:hypothetical protein